MTNMTRIGSFLLIGASLVSGVLIGVLVEFGRSEVIFWASVVEICCTGMVSYLMPALWFIKYQRASAKLSLKWLLVPFIGTLLAQLSIVQIPNLISRWGLDDGQSFAERLGEEWSSDFMNVFFFVAFYSVISCVIIGGSQLIALIYEWAEAVEE